MSESIQAVDHDQSNTPTQTDDVVELGDMSDTKGGFLGLTWDGLGGLKGA